MGKKETFEKMTTAQFLLMQLRRRRGKEIEAQFQTAREQARVLALLKMADAQEVDAMSAVLGMDAEALSELVVGLEAEGLVAVEGAAAPIAEPAAEVAGEEPADEAAADAEAVEPAVEAEGEDEPAEAPEAEEAAPADEAAAPTQLTVRITEAGRAWVQPPTDLAGLVLADFDDDALASFDAGLDTLVKALEGQCGASAAQLMDEERKRREEAAARPDRGRAGRDDRRDGGRKFGDRDRGGRGGFDRKGGKFGDRDRKGGDRRDGGRKFDRDDRRDGGRRFDGERKGGFKGDRRDSDDRGYRGKYDGFKGRRENRD